MRWRFPVVVLVMGRKVSPGQDIRFCCPDNATDFPANTAAGVLLWQASSRHTGPPQLLLNGMLTQTLQEEIWQWVAAVPPGKVGSYGQIPALAGSPRHSRYVGKVLRE